MTSKEWVGGCIIKAMINRMTSTRHCHLEIVCLLWRKRLILAIFLEGAKGTSLYCALVMPSNQLTISSLLFNCFFIFPTKSWKHFSISLTIVCCYGGVTLNSSIFNPPCYNDYKRRCLRGFLLLRKCNFKKVKWDAHLNSKCCTTWQDSWHLLLRLIEKVP